MGIRKITFDKGDIILAKDQAILYDLLLKQQTKTFLPNGENIYQNSTGFLIQNESEKLKYTYKITDDNVEFTFNPQLYLSICSRIIKLEKNTKLLVNKNDVADNENYYMVIRVDLNKEAKIINGELKEFGNTVEIKLINTKEKLTQDNLNQKSNNGIYEFTLISFIKKYNQDNSWEIKTQDESRYLLPLLMKSTHSPSKLLTITQKIEEEKENIENHLTDLKYRKIKELKELEEYISSRDIKNWKIVDNSKENLEREFSQKNNKWYILIYANRFILKERYYQDDKIKLFDFYNTADGITYKAIKFGQAKYSTLEDLVFYRWDGSIDEPNTPIIDQQNRL